MVTQWQNLMQKIDGNEAKEREIYEFYAAHNFDINLRIAGTMFFENEKEWLTEAGMNPTDCNLFQKIFAFLKESPTVREGHHMLYQYQSALEILQKSYPINEKLAEVIKKCLDKERDMLCILNEGLIPNIHDIADIINECKSDIEEVTRILEENCTEEIAGLVRMQYDPQQYLPTIIQTRTDVIQKMQNLLVTDQKPYPIYIYCKLVQALNKWRRCQQIKCISEDDSLPSLEPLQLLFEKFTEFLLKYKHEFEELQKLCHALQLQNEEGGNIDGCEKLDVTKQRLEEFFDALISKSFVIEEQPCQLFKLSSSTKKCGKFSMVVRFLVGNAIFKRDKNKPEVQLSFHCEHNLFDENKERIHSHGYNVVKNTALLTCGTKRNECHCRADFSDCQVIQFKRCEQKKTTEEVSERKYGIKVNTEFTTETIYGKTYQLEALTLPIVVTTQTSQDWSATGTLLWDSAFAEQERKPYQVVSTVPWPKLSIILSERFRAETGRGLDANHLTYLESKIFKTTPGTSISVRDAKEVTWSRFNKEVMGKKSNFTFWKWFYAVTNLTKMHLQKTWRDGLIHGFISKEDVKKKLGRPGLYHGNFILRFSESMIEDTQSANFGGALVVAYLVNKGENNANGHDIGFVEPFLPHQFEKTPICEFLLNVQVEENTDYYSNCELQYLYPNKPLHEAFRECMEKELEGRRKKQKEKDDGKDLDNVYKPFRIRFHIPRLEKPNRTSPFSPSSQPFSPHSPTYSNQVLSPQSEDSFQTAVGSPRVLTEPTFTVIPIPTTVPEDIFGQMLQNNMPNDSGQSFSLDQIDDLLSSQSGMDDVVMTNEQYQENQMNTYNQTQIPIPTSADGLQGQFNEQCVLTTL